jgi:hypothetical protein
MSTLMSTGFHDDAIQTLGNLVQGLESVAGGGVPINIEGFSRGAGAAIALTNELTQHRGFAGGDISTYLVDPFVGESNSRIRNRNVDVHVYFSNLPGVVPIAAPIFGFGRDIYQNGHGEQPLFGPSYSVFHGQMDSFDRGVLDLTTRSMIRGW